MPLAMLDARIAELVHLDVVDVRPDGSVCLNATFVATCLADHAASPASSEDVVRERILARAQERGHVPRSPSRLALAALCLGDADAILARA